MLHLCCENLSVYKNLLHGLGIIFKPKITKPGSLTHLSQMEFPIYQLNQSIIILRVIRFIFIKILIELSAVLTLVRRRILGRLIWVCSICLCPTKSTQGVNGLSMEEDTCIYYEPNLQSLDCLTNRHSLFWYFLL